MSLHEFHKPGKTFKQVKSEKMRIADRNGADKTHDVMVYMSTAGTPQFAVGLPVDYVNAWEKHRSKEHKDFHRDIMVMNNMVAAESYAKVIKHVESIAHNFQKHIRNLTMRKVIRMVLEIHGATGHKSHNPPSFSNARVLVGIRSAVCWEVNGGYYTTNNHKFAFNHDEKDGAPDPGQPAYADMVPTNMRGNPITIPFTEEAWTTVQQVENMLQRAGDMLLSLTNAESAVAVLQGGFQQMLAAPQKPVDPV